MSCLTKLTHLLYYKIYILHKCTSRTFITQYFILQTSVQPIQRLCLFLNNWIVEANVQWFNFYKLFRALYFCSRCRGGHYHHTEHSVAKFQVKNGTQASISSHLPFRYLVWIEPAQCNHQAPDSILFTNHTNTEL